jgi:hypothetical protein
MRADDLSTLPAFQRAQRFRRLAQHARAEAARCKGETRLSFIQIAEQWEMIAQEAEYSLRQAVDAADDGVNEQTPKATLMFKRCPPAVSR